MCGLAGIAGPSLGVREKRAFLNLFYASGLRGLHAAGCLILTKKDVSEASKSTLYYRILKKASPVTDFFQDPEFFKRIDENDVRCIIAHARSATIGKNSLDNTHPFKANLVVGVHNGTLVGDYPHKADFETDSEAIFNLIETDTAKEAVKKLTGAWALVWANLGDHTLNFLRNHQRDLFIAEDHNNNIYWASEKSMLIFALSREEITIKTIVKLKPEKHVSIKLFNSASMKDLSSGLVVEDASSFEAKSFVPWNRTYPGFNPVKSEEEKKEKDALTPEQDIVKNARALFRKESLARSLTTGNSKSRAIIGSNNKKGFKGFELSSKEYTALLEDGCVFCAATPANKKPVRWVNKTDFLCEACKDYDIFNYTDEPARASVTLN